MFQNEMKTKDFEKKYKCWNETNQVQRDRKK